MKFSMTVTPQRLRQLWYVPLLGLAMGLILVRTLVMAKLLDIPGFAQFSGGLLVSSTFSMLGGLGLYFLLQREMPVQIIRGRERAAALLVMQSLSAATACALAGLVLVAAGIEVGGLGPIILAIGIIHGLSQQVFLIATVESRSRGLPLTFALQTLMRAVIVLAVSIGIGALFKNAVVVLIAEAIVSLLLTYKVLEGVWQRARIGAALVLRLAARRIGRVRWSSAMVLLAVGSISFFLMNIDRWAAVRLLQPTDFAYYAFAWMVLMVAQSMQAVINAAVYPMLARQFASTGRAASFRIAAGASSSLLLACAITFWPAYWLMNAVVMRWFPSYAESRSIFGLFMVVAALRLSDFWSSHLIIVGQERRLLVVNFTTGTIVFASWFHLFVSEVNVTVEIRVLAWLAVGLTLSGYLVTAAVAWVARK